MVTAAVYWGLYPTFYFANYYIRQDKKRGDSPASTEQVSDPILPRLMCLQSPVLLVDSRSPQLR